MQPKAVWIVDGYNVLHRSARFEAFRRRPPEFGRDALLAVCRLWLARRRDVGEMVVVFDGTAPSDASVAAKVPRLRVLFSRHAQSADAVILRLLREAAEPARWTVVSDDTGITRPARRHGAQVVSSRDFPPTPPAPAGPADGAKTSLSSADIAQINAEMRAHWKVE